MPCVHAGRSMCKPREAPISTLGREGVRYFRCCHAQPVAEVERARAQRLDKMRADVEDFTDAEPETTKPNRTRACKIFYLKNRLACHEHTSMPTLCSMITDLFMLGKVPHWVAMILALTVFFGGIGLLLGKCDLQRLQSLTPSVAQIPRKRSCDRRYVFRTCC